MREKLDAFLNSLIINVLKFLRGKIEHHRQKWTNQNN